MSEVYTSRSLRSRLLTLLGIAFLLLALGLYFGTRAIAENAADLTQDHTLSASLNAVAEQLSVVDGEISVDLPYAALALLGAAGDDRVFYRVSREPGGELTGYPDLPHGDTREPNQPVFNTTQFRGDAVRVATTHRQVFDRIGVSRVTLSIAQSRDSRTDIIDGVARNAAVMGVVFLLCATALAWFASGNALAPLRKLSLALGTRQPHDTRALQLTVPQEVAPVVQALNGFLSRLRTNLTNTETLIADAAHRVRTPLTAVKAQAQLALQHSEDDTQRQRLRNLLRAVDQTARSTNQILDHAMVTFRSDGFTRGERRERTDICALVAKTLKELHYTAELRDINFDTSLPTSPLWLHADPILVTEAVRNVVDNAIKYSPPESTITVELTASAHGADLLIADRGCGIAVAEHDRVRERFVRGSNAGKVVGSGLGLTIVQNVMATHNGRLHFATRPGGGTRVTLHFPTEPTP